MRTVNAKQVLSDLYGLMMEINLHRADKDVLEELQAHPDLQIENHLLKIKQLNAKLKAQKNNVLFHKALEQFNILRQKGLDEIEKLLNPQEQAQLIPLFRKFKELTKEDEASILEDQELLSLIEKLKDRIDENPEH